MSVNGGSNFSSNRRESVNEAVKEIDQLRQSIHHCRELASRIKSSELSLSTDETAYKTELSKCRKRLMDLGRALDPELQLEAEELEAGLKYVERIRPVARIPLLLKLSLGEACFVLPDTRQRLKYKKEYENFKLQATIVHLVLSLIQLFLIKGTLSISFVLTLTFYPFDMYNSTACKEHPPRHDDQLFVTLRLLHHYSQGTHPLSEWFKHSHLVDHSSFVMHLPIRNITNMACQSSLSQFTDSIDNILHLYCCSTSNAV